MKSKKEICLENTSKAYRSGLGGLEIRFFEYGIYDYVYYVTNCWYAGKGVKFHKSKIETTNCGDNYFRCNGYRIYLRDCIRM